MNKLMLGRHFSYNFFRTELQGGSQSFTNLQIDEDHEIFDIHSCIWNLDE